MSPGWSNVKVIYESFEYGAKLKYLERAVVGKKYFHRYVKKKLGIWNV